VIRPGFFSGIRVVAVSIPHSEDRLNDVTRATRLGYLAPNSGDVRVDGSSISSVVVAPHVIEEFLAVEYPTRPSGHEIDQIKLSRGQLNEFLVDMDFTSARIDLEGRTQESSRCGEFVTCAIDSGERFPGRRCIDGRA
jgi:hypothetical protein